MVTLASLGAGSHRTRDENHGSGLQKQATHAAYVLTMGGRWLGTARDADYGLEQGIFAIGRPKTAEPERHITHTMLRMYPPSPY